MRKEQSLWLCRTFVFETLNVPRRILNLVVGKEHPLVLRLVLGILICILSTLLPEEHRAYKALAELIHAFGAIPVLEFMVELSAIENAKLLQQQAQQETKGSVHVNGRASLFTNDNALS